MESTTSKKSYWLGRRPGHQGPRPISGSQGMVEKSTTGANIKLRKPIKFGTWNVRSLLQVGKLNLLENELARLSIKICGFSEVWWTGKGHFMKDTGHKVVYSGSDQKHRQGVALWLHSDIANSLISYEPISPRLICATLRATPQNITVIQVYAPTTSDNEDDQEQFYEDLQRAINKAPKRSTMVVLGDFNAKIGKCPSQLPTVGQYGLGERNDAGDTLFSFCEANSLSIVNTLFKQPARRQYTWTSPDGKHRNQIDYILVHKRWRKSITNCRTYPGSDCNSDHNLLVATFKAKFQKVENSVSTIKLDLQALKGHKGLDYAAAVSNRFEALNLLEQENTPQELWTATKEILKEEAAKHIKQPKRSKVKNWLSQEALERAAEKRYAKTYNPEKYKKLKAEVQRLVRRDKQEYIEGICGDIERESKKGNSRSLFRCLHTLTDERKVKLNMIKNSNGQVLINPIDIAGRWKEYTEELYNTADTRSQLPSSLENQREPPPLMSEIESAINGIKLGKAPGSDEIPIELIRSGGQVTKQVMHKICTEVWETGEWPEDWGSSTFIPIPKKGDISQCTNYRTISLVSHASKVLLKVILNRIQTKTEHELPDEQAGFRPGRGTRDQTTNLRIIMAKHREYNQPLYMCFIDFRKAFDSVQHEKLWWTMLDMGYPPHLVNLLAKLYKNQKAAVRVAGVVSDWFRIGKGVRQGCILSPYLFNIVSEMVMRKALHNFQGGITIGGRKISNLRYADDIVLLASSAEELQDLVNRITRAGEEYNLLINSSKTKIMALNGEPFTIKINNEELEQVNKFTYLGSIIADDSSCSADIKHRLALGNCILTKLKTLWQGHTLTLQTKVRLIKALVWSVTTYGGESWTIKKDDEKKLQAFEMKTLRRVLGISWREHKTNESIIQETGYKREFLGLIKQKKLAYAGHVMRKNNSLEKTIVQGMVPGKRNRGRPRRSWMDDITDWSGLSVENVVRTVQDRQKWRMIVQNAAKP